MNLEKKILSICLALLLTVCLAATVEAAGNYVIDDAGLLTQQERSELNACAANITRNREIGIYILTVYDYRDYGYSGDVFDTTWQIYHDRKLGMGSDRQGMILLLSMKERDYATFFYGDDTEYAFNAYGQEELEQYFLDDFKRNDWYSGFHDYLTQSRDFMQDAADGDPVRKSSMGRVLIFVAVALLLSGIITLIPYVAMKNVKRKVTAGNYIVGTGLNLTRREDRFTHQTRSVRTIQSSSGSGSRSRSGGGGSGRSGKF